MVPPVSLHAKRLLRHVQYDEKDPGAGNRTTVTAGHTPFVARVTGLLVPGGKPVHGLQNGERIALVGVNAPALSVRQTACRFACSVTE